MIDVNPTFMKEILERSVSNNRPVRQNYKMNLVSPETNQGRYGTKSLRSLAPKIWNSSPVSIKSSENLESLKKSILFFCFFEDRVWGIRRGQGGGVYPNSLASLLFIVCRCPVRRVVMIFP